MTFRVQQQIKHNAIEIQSYVQDLYDWEDKVEGPGKEQATSDKPSQVVVIKLPVTQCRLWRLNRVKFRRRTKKTDRITTSSCGGTRTQSRTITRLGTRSTWYAL